MSTLHHAPLHASSVQAPPPYHRDSYHHAMSGPASMAEEGEGGVSDELYDSDDAALGLSDITHGSRPSGHSHGPSFAPPGHPSATDPGHTHSAPTGLNHSTASASTQRSQRSSQRSSAAGRPTVPAPYAAPPHSGAPSPPPAPIPASAPSHSAASQRPPPAPLADGTATTGSDVLSRLQAALSVAVTKAVRGDVLLRQLLESGDTAPFAAHRVDELCEAAIHGETAAAAARAEQRCRELEAEAADLKQQLRRYTVKEAALAATAPSDATRAVAASVPGGAALQMAAHHGTPPGAYPPALSVSAQSGAAAGNVSAADALRQKLGGMSEVAALRVKVASLEDRHRRDAGVLRRVKAAARAAASEKAATEQAAWQLRERTALLVDQLGLEETRKAAVEAELGSLRSAAKAQDAELQELRIAAAALSGKGYAGPETAGADASVQDPGGEHPRVPAHMQAEAARGVVAEQRGVIAACEARMEAMDRDAAAQRQELAAARERSAALEAASREAVAAVERRAASEAQEAAARLRAVEAERDEALVGRRKAALRSAVLRRHSAQRDDDHERLLRELVGKAAAADQRRIDAEREARRWRLLRHDDAGAAAGAAKGRCFACDQRREADAGLRPKGRGIAASRGASPNRSRDTVLSVVPDVSRLPTPAPTRGAALAADGALALEQRMRVMAEEAADRFRVWHTATGGLARISMALAADIARADAQRSEAVAAVFRRAQGSPSKTARRR